MNKLLRALFIRASIIVTPRALNERPYRMGQFSDAFTDHAVVELTRVFGDGDGFIDGDLMAAYCMVTA